MGVTSNPKFTGQIVAAFAEAQPDPFTLLFVGQTGTDGTAVDGQLYTDVERKSIDEVKTLFGTEGDLTARILKARTNIQGRSPIEVISLTANGAGVAATRTVTVTGTATEDGTLTIKAIDSDNYTFNVAVTTGDTADDVANNIKTAIDALVGFPATAGTVTTGVFTLTANDVGTLPNKYTVKTTTTVAGITVAVGQFTGGLNDPALTGIFDNVQARRFHSVLWPYEDDFTEVKDFLEARNVVNNKMLHGMALIGYDDTEANITAKVNGTPKLNSPNLVFVGNRAIAGEYVEVTPPDWRAAEFASIEAMRQTPDVPIGKFVTITSPRDLIGGPALASLPYHNTPLALTDIADPDLLFDQTEQDNLLSDGYTIVGVNSSSTTAIMGPVVTTYKTNTLGDPDVSFKYLNYVRTAYLCLEIFLKTLKSTYSQYRLTEGALVNNRAIANEESIRGKYLEIYQTLSGEDYVLTQGGSEANTFFNDNLTISLDMATGKVTSFGKLPIVTQLREIIATFQLAFSITE